MFGDIAAFKLTLDHFVVLCSVESFGCNSGAVPETQVALWSWVAPIASRDAETDAQPLI